MQLSEQADRIAARFKKHDKGEVIGDALRDLCDLASGGELDTIQLDILTDMVRERLKS
jgi:hypothetical protein